MWTLLLAAALAAPADDPPTADEPAPDLAEAQGERAVWQDPGIGWGALPALNYNSDDGFGYGAIGSIYKYDGETSPYRWQLAFLVFLTTKGIHNHRLAWDVVDLADDKLRLTGRIGLRVSRSDNYCGLGGDVSCSLAEPEAIADARDLRGDARDTFVRQYYRARFVNPLVQSWARYKLHDAPKIEALLGVHLRAYTNGDLTTDGPFPGSLLEQEFTDAESEGLYSQISTGLMLDTRDFEPSPSRGWWIEGTIRGASRFWGSDFEAFGQNLTVRTYAPLVDRKLVLASRTIFDGIVGDVPPREYSEVGGTNNISALGGDAAGRGIRARRYRGRILMLEQLELRWWFVRIPVGKTPIDLTVLGFVDAGHVAADWSDTFSTPPVFGEGAGLRVAIGESFIVRVDAGFSAVEDYSMGLYIDVNNLF